MTARYSAIIKYSASGKCKGSTSDGQLTISVLPPTELGDYQETFNLVSSGKVEMCPSLSYDWRDQASLALRDRGFAFDIFTFVSLG